MPLAYDRFTVKAVFKPASNLQKQDKTQLKAIAL